MKSNLKVLLAAAVVAGMMGSSVFGSMSCGSGGTGGGVGGGSAGGGTGGGSTGGGTGGGSTGGGTGGGTAGGTGGGTAGGAGGGTAGGAGGGTAGGAGGGTAGGAGGGGGAGGAGGGTAAATCAAYCTTIAGCGANPDGGTTFQQYSANADCLGTCSAFVQGDAGTTAGNTLECRAYHAGVAVTSTANKTTHCPHAGPAGDGVCGGNCESFCTIAAAKCPGVFPGDAGSCTTACAAYAGNTARYNSATTAGNSFACRMYHLSVAASSAANALTHCPHIAPNGAPCQ